MTHFVAKGSVVREIWGKGDTILLIFAGASAEFALNKAVDWLYFTGKLPSDPLKRLFSTVSYARQIVFSNYEDAIKAIKLINAIHAGVESKRGQQIPDWAYRDVLYMLIDYSIRSFELMERKLNEAEKNEVFDVFYRMGLEMNIKDLPRDFKLWEVARASALTENLSNSACTKDLYKQYRKHLGWFRYFVLIQAQILLVPATVNTLLNLGKSIFAALILRSYQLSKYVGLKNILKNALLPPAYKKEIRELDIQQ